MLRYCHRFIIFSFSICGFLYGLKGQQEHIQIPKSTFSLNNYNPSNDYLPSIQWVIEENDIKELERSIQQDSISKEKLIYFNDKESFWAITNTLYWFNIRVDSSITLDNYYLHIIRNGNCLPWEFTFFEVFAYQFKNNHLKQVGISGNNIPASVRDTPHHINPSIVSLRHVEGTNTSLWVGVKLKNSCNLRIQLILSEFDGEHLYGGGKPLKPFLTLLLYGAISVLFILVLFLYIKFHQPIYFWSIIFLIFLFLDYLYISFENILFSEVFSEHPRWFIFFYSASATGLIMSVLQVWRVYINTFDEYPFISKVIKYVIIFFLCFSVLNTSMRFMDFTIPYWYQYRVPILLTAFISIFIISLYLLIFGSELARFLSVGILTFSVAMSLALFIIRMKGDVDSSPFEGAVGIALVLFLTLALAYRFVLITKQKEHALVEKINIEKQSNDQLIKINEASNRFVPNAFLSFLGRNNILQATLGDSKERSVSILFSDIRNYTSISEGMSPQETFKFVSDFNKGIGPIIIRNNGFINQYLGDGIVAIFPEKPEDALQAALEMKTYQSDFAQRFLDFDFDIGIGLHYGEIVMGIMGDEERLDAAIISDAMNVTSRVEMLTKKYYCSILTTDAFRENIRTKSTYHFRYLGNTSVKGKSQSLSIYHCLDYLDSETVSEILGYGHSFDRAVHLMEDGESQEAFLLFSALSASYPQDKTLEVMKNQCYEYS